MSTMHFVFTPNNPVSPANPPERGPRADNGKRPHETNSVLTAKQKVPTGGESNKTIKREVGLICVQPSESSLVTGQLYAWCN